MPQPGDHAPLLTLLGLVAHVDVFVDDFIGLAQGSQRQCHNIRQCIMHTIDKVFTQRYADTMHQKEAILEKKLAKGDGGWNQCKEILGWMLDSERMTLELTERWAKWIVDIFQDLRGQSRVIVKKWQRVLGELQFMGPAVPGSAGLFGALQLGLAHSDKHRVKITHFLRNHLSISRP